MNVIGLAHKAHGFRAVLNSEGHGQRQFLEVNYGAGRPHLSFEQIESVAVPFPPIEEQLEITERVTANLGAFDLIALEINHAKMMSTAQRQNILRAAFSGQLVPQGPNDEPASVLLERIRTERAARVAPLPRTRHAPTQRQELP